MTIPGMTLSGGKLSQFGGPKAVRQYRVWVHPKGSGDDEYWPFTPVKVRQMGGIKGLFKATLAYSKSAKGKKYHVEVPLAVVANPNWRKGMEPWKKYREVVIDRKYVV